MQEISNANPELRLGVEMQAAALAAARRTPETLAEIARAYDYLDALETDDAEIEARADFEFHLAIARATRNPDFPNFLEAVMESINFELVLKHRQSSRDYRTYLKKNQQGARLNTLGDHSRKRKSGPKCYRDAS